MNELKDGNHGSGCVKVSDSEIKRTKDKLGQILSGHRIAVDEIKWVTGPAVSLFEKSSHLDISTIMENRTACFGVMFILLARNPAGSLTSSNSFLSKR